MTKSKEDEPCEKSHGLRELLLGLEDEVLANYRLCDLLDVRIAAARRRVLDGRDPDALKTLQVLERELLRAERDLAAADDRRSSAERQLEKTRKLLKALTSPAPDPAGVERKLKALERLYAPPEG